MIGKLQVSVLRSLAYVLALIVTRRSLPETSEEQNLFMKRLVCSTKLYGAGSVGPESGTRNDCGFSRNNQNHSFTANDLMVDDTPR